jgi:Na+/proline symporter
MLAVWLIVVAYMLFVFFKGVSKAKEIETADDFLVAGRSVRWFFLFCTMGATVIGGGDVLFPRDVYAVMEKIDTSVFGVLVSVAVCFSVMLFVKKRQ